MLKWCRGFLLISMSLHLIWFLSWWKIIVQFPGVDLEPVLQMTVDAP
jgi:hypothetical protein